MSELEICIYDRVKLSNGNEGEVQFMGPIENKQGIFYGIKLDEPIGKNNGSVGDVVYFVCDDKYGIFQASNKILTAEPTSLNKILPRVCIEDKVHVKHKKICGVLRYVGIIEDKQGCWYGVELDDPLGKNDGSVDERQYFECDDYYGIFCQMKNIEIMGGSKRKKGGNLKSQSHAAPTSKSDLSGIKSNYNANNPQPKNPKKPKKVAILAPPPPMDEPPVSPRSKKNKTNLLDRDIESMGFIQLKARCGMEGLSTFGTKKQLLGRLRHHLNKSNPSQSTNNNNTSNKKPNTNNNMNKLVTNADKNGTHRKAASTQVPSYSNTSNNNNNNVNINNIINVANNINNSVNKNNNSYDPDKDPDLHDLDPDKDDFFKPLTVTGNNDSSDSDDDESRGSVILKEEDKVDEFRNKNTNNMSALADDDEEEVNHKPQPKNTKLKYQPKSSTPPPVQHSTKQLTVNKTPLTTVKSVGSIPNNGAPGPPSPASSNASSTNGANDWIMLPDPGSGKMYYANLKTRETRWQPPPGFGVQESNLNPQYNPQIQFQNPSAQQANWNGGQQQYNPAIWQTQSTTHLGAYNNLSAGGAGAVPYSIARQVSPFQSSANFNQYQQPINPASAYQNQYNNYPKSAMNMSQSSASIGSNASSNYNNNNNNNNQQPYNKTLPTSNSAKNVITPQPKKKESTPSNNKKPVDPLAKLEAEKWKKTKDPTTGREYWYHKDTKQTTWDTPPAVLKVSGLMNTAEHVVTTINTMEQIEKADWEQESEESGSYSTSGSYYSDGDDTDDEDDDKKKQAALVQSPQQQQAALQQANNFNNMGGGNPQYNQANYNYNQQQQNNPNYNQQQQQQQYMQQQQMLQQQQAVQHAAYMQHQQMMAQRQKADEARNMYLKPSANKNSSRQKQQMDGGGLSEDNPWISAEEAKSRVIVRDTLKRYWQIGAEQTFKLEDWAKQQYALKLHKKGVFNKKLQTIADILSFADFGKFKHPLNKTLALDEKLESLAKQTWKNINSYMGNRKSGKSSEGHVEKLIRFALKGDHKLRNEIYCQLAKQTTKNPKIQSLLKGWKLLLICCSFYPPSDNFVDYLACFIWQNTQQPNEIGQYAIKALHALDATMLSGPRKFPPLPLEIVKLENLQPIPLNIYFINGMKCKQVLVTSQTRAKQVIDTLAQTFSFQHPEAFGLYEMEPNIPTLDRMKKHYIKREMMGQQEKINDLIRMPFERELEDDDRMLDVIASWLKRDQSKRRKGAQPVDKASSKKKKKYKSAKNVRFVLKVKTYRKSMEKTFSLMGAKANYLTHVWHFINDFYPIDIQDEDFSFDLAALQLQGTYGPKPKLKAINNSKFDKQSLKNNNTQAAFYKSGLIAYDLHKYLPQIILKKYLPAQRNECEEKILIFREKKFAAMSRKECWLRYAKLLRNNKKLFNYFGCSWYRGVRIQSSDDEPAKSKKYKNSRSIIKTDRNSNDLLVGINEHAISFVNPITQNVVERYQMEEILTFGYRSNAFLFVAGTLMTQTKMQIATMHGKAMNRLVRTHIDLRVRDAEKSGRRMKNIPKQNI